MTKITDEEVAVGEEIIDLLKEKQVPIGSCVKILANLILNLVSHIAIDEQSAVAGVEAITTDMVKSMKAMARASAN